MNVPFNVMTFNTPIGPARPPGVDVERLRILVCEPRHEAIGGIGRATVNQGIRRKSTDIDLTPRPVLTEIPRRPAAIHISRDELSMEE